MTYVIGVPEFESVTAWGVRERERHFVEVVIRTTGLLPSSAPMAIELRWLGLGGVEVGVTRIGVAQGAQAIATFDGVTYDLGFVDIDRSSTDRLEFELDIFRHLEERRVGSVIAVCESPGRKDSVTEAGRFRITDR